MLLLVVDAEGQQQTIVAQSQANGADQSDTITETGVSQTLMAANVDRAGWLFQNNGAAAMRVNELGNDAAGAGSWVVAPGAFFPPAGMPVPTGEITVSGTATQAYSAREW